MNLFLSNPPLYFHPATWEKPLIPHGTYEGLPPQGQLIAIILGLLLFLVGYGLYLTFGAGTVSYTHLTLPTKRIV